MARIHRSVRFANKDKIDYAEFHSKQTEKITSNQDFNTARELVGIDDAAQKICEAQIEAANMVTGAIYDSTNMIINNQNVNTDRVVNSLEDLKATFDWKLSEMIWILEQQRDYFKGILELLKRPRLAQANELRESGIDKYKKNWIDEAFDDLIKAKELNQTDFIIHQSLGNIYLFQKKDLEKALVSYKNAAKYAHDYPYYVGYALLHVGLQIIFQEIIKKHMTQRKKQ